MRRFLMILAVAACSFSPAAFALAPETAADDNDGSLAVRNGRAVVTLDVHGVVIGQIDAGKVIVSDPVDERGSSKSVRGAESSKSLTDTKTRFRGDDMRFRLVGGSWRVTIVGRGIDLSVVGQGTARMSGTAGRYSLNDGPFRPLPSDTTQFSLSP